MCELGMLKETNLLLVEDNPADQELITTLLQNSSTHDYKVTVCERINSGMELIKKENFKIILLDLTLPDAMELEALEQIVEYTSKLPIIILTGYTDESLAIEALRKGAQDYLIKGKFDMNTLFRSMNYATERKSIENALKESEYRFRALFEQSRDAIGFFELDGSVQTANQAFLELLDQQLEEIKSRKFKDFTPKKWEEKDLEIMQNQVLKKGYSEVYEKEYIQKNGSVIPIEIRKSLLKSDMGSKQIFSVIRNISKRKNIETQLRYRSCDLEERIKKINCLYGIAKAKDDPHRSLEEVFQSILKLIPPAWQYPEITCSRILFEGKEFVSENFKETPWKQSADILIEGEKVGVIDVHYLKEKFGVDEGPFLKEERDLLDRMASEISEFIKHQRTDIMLNVERTNIRRILNSMEDSVLICNTEYEVNFVNASYNREFGPITKKKCFEYFTDKSEPCSWCNIKKIQAGKTIRREWANPIEQKTYDVIDTPFRNPDGSLSILEIFRDITERKQMEEKVRESEEKFRRIFTQAFDAILIVDRMGEIIDANDATCTLLEYERNNFLDLTLRGMLPEREYQKILKFNGNILEEKTSQKGEFTFRTNRGKQIHTEVGGTIIEIAGDLYVVLSFRDITDRIKREEEMMRNMMKFNIEDGNVYLIKENSLSLSLSAFQDLLNVGFQGLVISRTPQTEFENQFPKTFDYFWLAEQKKEVSIIDSAYALIETMPKRSVILIDRLDYLLTKTGFDTTIEFIFKIREVAYFNKFVILISIDPAVISSTKLNLLAKETKEITPRFIVKLPEEMLEILRYLYKMNNLGIKPSYSDVRDELLISRPTVSKRIKKLISTGYANETSMGNRKILELSQKGRTLFLLK